MRQRLLARVVVGDNAARLHRSGDQALADDALLDDDIGFGESLVDVAVLLVIRERDVVRRTRDEPAGLRASCARSGSATAGVGS